MTAEGEATGAIATTAGKAIDLLRGLGGYTAEVVGDALKDFVGLAVGDRLKARRIENMRRLGLLSGPLLEGIDPAAPDKRPRRFVRGCVSWRENAGRTVEAPVQVSPSR